ncbi:DNA primase [Mycobacterium phage DrLupo]|uniref:DNA primase/polymerase n=1 Tax=Mycobacterium phage DrLupo TaxID=2499037 RepID=A0A3S9UQR8_9CAUD|nr:DNA primase [Mycobacterium phage DrLupo]AZS12645.1 DNA primase/polymerase [Mycobacterium phage DrLupo]
MPEKKQPRSLSPFRDSWKLYRKANWFGTLPLPAKKKNPPPTGFTGHAAPWPQKAEFERWLNGEDADKYRRGNICLRLGGVDSEYEVIGIDVDHYLKGDKEKRGGEQLQALENAHGPLPDTWISSARTDGVSGIRYYRVPRGLAFRGQVEKDIECIQKGHRFAVVWPSFNPDSQSDYWWFPPGTPLTTQGRLAWTPGEIPDAKQLPLLPDQWIDFLTRGRMEAGKVEIDMDSSVDDIYAWADEKFGKDEDMCFRMKEKAETHVKKIETEATSHPLLIAAHRNIFHLACEGHKGWASAVNMIEQAFVKVVTERDKRSIDELRGEIFRSRINGLRKAKATVDAKIAAGAEGVPARDLECGSNDDQGIPLLGGSASPPGSNLFDIPRKQSSPASEYRQNDDGNADHFIDIWSDANVGPAVRYVEGYGWLIWHNGDHGERQPHWEVDPEGQGTMRQMFRYVRDKQEDYAENLHVDYVNAARALAQQTPGVSAQDVRDAKSAWSAWNKFAQSSGNNRNADNAIKAIRTHAGICVDINKLDARPELLGVANGVIELNPDGAKLRPAEPEDYITLNTGVPWLDPKEIPNTGQKLWNDYLDKFLPDQEYRKVVQMILGHALIGGNPHKKLIFFHGPTNTGKSVLASMLNEVLGDYAKMVNKTIFQNHKLNPILAEALSKRVVILNEISGDNRNGFAPDVIKSLSGGSDTVQAELKGKNATVDKIPMFLSIVVTNVAPSIEGLDKALIERIRVINFDHSEENPDDTIAARMRRESPVAVLNWLIEGYNLYCKQGRRFPEHERMLQATKSFTSSMDMIAAFIEDEVETHTHMGRVNVRWQDSPEWVLTPAQMNTAYEQWCETNKIPHKERISQYRLTSRLQELGFIYRQARIQKKSSKYFLGVKLKHKQFGTNVKPDGSLNIPGITGD